MRYPAMVLMAALLSSTALMAQSNTPATSTHGSTALFIGGPVNESCPVNFFVDRMSVPVMRTTIGDKSARSGLGLEMNLIRFGASAVKATVTVHGASNQARLMPAAARSNADTTETFELRSDAGEQSQLHAAVWLKKMNAVSWVDLTDIEYADGSTWHASHLSECRAAPSKFLPVNIAAQ